MHRHLCIIIMLYYMPLYIIRVQYTMLRHDNMSNSSSSDDLRMELSLVQILLIKTYICAGTHPLVEHVLCIYIIMVAGPIRYPQIIFVYMERYFGGA